MTSRIVYVVALSPESARELAVDFDSKWHFGDDVREASREARRHGTQAYAVPLSPGEPALIPYCTRCDKPTREDGQDYSAHVPEQLCQCAERDAIELAAESGLE